MEVALKRKVMDLTYARSMALRLLNHGGEWISCALFEGMNI